MCMNLCACVCVCCVCLCMCVCVCLGQLTDAALQCAIDALCTCYDAFWVIHNSHVTIYNDNTAQRT